MGNIIKYATDLSIVTSDLQKVQRTLRKYGPLIGTVSGVIGLGVTAKLAYDSKGKVDAITTKYEEKLANGEVISKKDMVVEYGVALAPAVITGALSVGCIIGSYHVLTNRVHLLNMALNTVRDENKQLKDQLRGQSEDGVYAPVETKEVETEDENGEKKVVESVARRRSDLSTGCWFDNSTEWFEDDSSYNLAVIAQAQENLNSKLMRDGILKVTDIYSALHIPLTADEKVSLYGFVFYDSDFFTLDTVVVHLTDETGRLIPTPYIEWPSPRYDLDIIDN